MDTSCPRDTDTRTPSGPLLVAGRTPSLSRTESLPSPGLGGPRLPCPLLAPRWRCPPPPSIICCNRCPSRVLGRIPSREDCRLLPSRVVGRQKPPSMVPGRLPSCVQGRSDVPSRVVGRSAQLFRALTGQSGSAAAEVSEAPPTFPPAASSSPAPPAGPPAAAEGTAVELEDGAALLLVPGRELAATPPGACCWASASRRCWSRASTPTATSRKDLPMLPRGARAKLFCTLRTSV
mmetsp:Transcript_159991/g.513328  ORF Transcript_159991/g.513328 Transcript_159991/m.513328 type:complete len:235 (+) Transcript_159991:217-921(+)